MSKKYYIAIDFDGSIVENENPDINFKVSNKVYADEYWDDKAVIIDNDKVIGIK